MKILVLTKARYDYGIGSYGTAGYGNPIGLNNGAAFITDALTELGYDVSYQTAIDGNEVDKLVTAAKADIVLLEALWVTPTKLKELAKLHQSVSWLVRLHSNIPFLGMEGMAFSWVKQLSRIPKVQVVANNRQTATELSSVLQVPIPFLPNIYLAPLYSPGKGRKRHDTYLDVSCFGAMRPFKNQLIQGVAAVQAAEKLGRKLRFHVNGTRIEQKGESVMQNLTALFEGTEHELVLHGWQTHEDFLYTIAKMDIGLQVSFTESFNIVAADHVHVGVPIVTSDEINWLSHETHASCTSVEDISDTLIRELHAPFAAEHNRRCLERYNEMGNKVWIKFLSTWQS